VLGLRRTREAGDPLTGIPRIHGGQDVRGNMRAAHRSCNARRSATRARALGREDLDRRVTRGEAPGGDVVTRPDAGKWKPTAVPNRGPLV
jgi:hypothetical protein